MTHELMDDIRLRSVKGLRRMSDILSRMEDSEGKGIQELSLCQESSNGPHSPSSLLLQILANIFELRDISLRETTVLLHLFKGSIVGSASSMFV